MPNSRFLGCDHGANGRPADAASSTLPHRFRMPLQKSHQFPSQVTLDANSLLTAAAFCATERMQRYA